MKIRQQILLFPFLICIILPLSAVAGEWRVTPISLEFTKDAKSGVITVTNEGAEKLNVQMKAMEWTQDAEGKDVYTDTADLIFFPKLMTIEKNSSRVIRAGIKAPAVAREKTYRLFVEEIPEPKKSDTTSVSISIKFGVPIFVKPLKEEAKGEISAVTLSHGVLTTVVKNTGNVQFRITSLKIRGKNSKGEESFASELAGWYLLSGASRSYSAALPHEGCTNSEKVEVEIKTAKLTIAGKLDVNKAMCSP